MHAKNELFISRVHNIYTTLTPQIKGNYRAIFFIFPFGRGYIMPNHRIQNISLTTRLIALMQANCLLSWGRLIAY